MGGSDNGSIMSYCTEDGPVRPRTGPLNVMACEPAIPATLSLSLVVNYHLSVRHHVIGPLGQEAL